jgi:hypothetical protein
VPWQVAHVQLTNILRFDLTLELRICGPQRPSAFGVSTLPNTLVIVHTASAPAGTISVTLLSPKLRRHLPCGGQVPDQPHPATCIDVSLCLVWESCEYHQRTRKPTFRARLCVQNARLIV